MNFRLCFSVFVILSVVLISGCIQQNIPVACTEEAKICPDGSAVGRVLPDCEFAPCPNTTANLPNTTEEEHTSGQQTTTTNKDVYSAGEKINITYSDSGIDRCTCMGPRLIFYKLTGNVWNELSLDIDAFVLGEWRNWMCINGVIRHIPRNLGCDAIACKPGFSKDIFSYEWDAKYYDYAGLVDTCQNSSESIEYPEDVEFPLVAYSFVTAPSGKYKIKFGNAEKIIEIK